MRICIDLPSTWTSRREGSGSVWTLEGTALRIEVDGLVSLPFDRKAWGNDVLRRAVALEARVDQVDLVATTGRTGWPVTVVTTLVRAPSGAILESRVSCFFEFLYYGGVVVCRILPHDAERWTRELRTEVMACVINATPDFRGPVARIDELFEMDEAEEASSAGNET